MHSQCYQYLNTLNRDTMIKQRFLQLFIAICLTLVNPIANAHGTITVFAAASLTNALSEISAQYEQEHAVKVAHSFAASSTLAKQIENGAPADIFISADTKWMNFLENKSLVNAASRKAFLSNKLVLIAPKGRQFNVTFNQTFNFAKAFNGKLCTGDVESVPAGIYAKQALSYYHWWSNIKTRVVGAQDVRGALSFVERGECAAGIVYETDAKVSNKVEVVGIFEQASHEAILYPMALVTNIHKPKLNLEAEHYLDYLHTNKALAIFKKYGFATQ